MSFSIIIGNILVTDKVYVVVQYIQQKNVAFFSSSSSP